MSKCKCHRHFCDICADINLERYQGYTVGCTIKSNHCDFCASNKDIAKAYQHSRGNREDLLRLCFERIFKLYRNKSLQEIIESFPSNNQNVREIVNSQYTRYYPIDIINNDTLQYETLIKLYDILCQHHFGKSTKQQLDYFFNN